MQVTALAKPKILVPLVLLFWLMVSLPLSVFSYAAEVSGTACGNANSTDSTSSSYWARGVWGMPGIDPYFTGSTPHLGLQGTDTCFQVNSGLQSGYLVDGEWWKDYPGDSYGCDTSSAQTSYNTCSDEDKNWYLKLSSGELSALGVTSGEVKNLQRWSECKAGQKKSSRWCNFLTETIPVGGNYGFYDPSKYNGNPTDDQSQLPDPCLDNDFNPNTTETNPCRGKKIQISFTGARVFDNNHSWKEIHPVRKEQWKDSSSGTTRCYSVNDTAQDNPTNGYTASTC
jgi:hypothetical protein